MCNSLPGYRFAIRWFAIGLTSLIPACSTQSLWVQPSPSVTVPSPTPKAIAPTPVRSPVAPPVNDAIQAAEDKAISASSLAQSAQSQDDWNLAVQQWQRAIALLKSVPANSSNRALAQKLLPEYQRNLELTRRRVKVAPIQTTSTPPKDGIPLIAGGEPTAVNPEAARTAQTEARTIVASLNRAQQAFYLEQKRFATSIEELKVNVKPETPTYLFAIAPANANQVTTTATAKAGGLRSYTGGVFVSQASTGEEVTLSAICETSQPTNTAPAAPEFVNNEIRCPAGSTRL